MKDRCSGMGQREAMYFPTMTKPFRCGHLNQLQGSKEGTSPNPQEFPHLTAPILCLKPLVSSFCLDFTCVSFDVSW